MASPRTSHGFKTGVPERSAETPARDPRRGPDAVTTEAFAKIHRMRERFSVTAVTAAMVKARTEKAK